MYGSENVQFIVLGLTTCSRKDQNDLQTVGTPNCQHTKLSAHQTVSTPNSRQTKLSAHQTFSTPNCQHTKLSAHQTVGRPNCQHTKLSAHQTVGTPNCRHTKLSAHQTVGTPNCQNIKLSAHRRITEKPQIASVTWSLQFQPDRVCCCNKGQPDLRRLTVTSVTWMAKNTRENYYRMASRWTLEQSWPIAKQMQSIIFSNLSNQILVTINLLSACFGSFRSSSCKFGSSS